MPSATTTRTSRITSSGNSSACSRSSSGPSCVKRGDGSYVLGEKADGDATFESVFAKGPKYAARPALPGGEELLDPPGSRRQLFAKSLPGNNRAFNRNIANRLWAMMMGRGLVHPVDFDHSDNPPTHPELLDRLADEIAATKYDVRSFLKEIALSKTYQRSFDLPADVSALASADALETAATAAKNAVESASAELKTARKEALAAREAIDKPLKDLRAKEAELAKLQKAAAPAAAALAVSQGQLKAKTDAIAAAVKALESAKQALAAVPADADLKARRRQAASEIEAVRHGNPGADEDDCHPD